MNVASASPGARRRVEVSSPAGVIAARRLNGNAVPLDDRMRGVQTLARKAFVCPVPAASE